MGCGSFNGNNSNGAEGQASGNPVKELERFSDTYFDVFDTVIEIIAYSEDEEDFKAMSELAHKELRHYHYLFDIYKRYDGMNNARSVNRKAGEEPVEVSEEFIELIEKSKELYDLTGGKVNIAMGSVLSLWHEARETSLENPENAFVPDMEVLKAASEHTNIEDVIVDKDAGTVFLKDPEMSLDLGAIAKGFAVEKVAQELEAAGYTNFIISAGGNVRASGKRGDGTDWVVAVQNPNTESDKAFVDTIEISDGSLVTSGVYRRFYEYEGKRYHHIVDPNTLQPESRYLSVSIRTKDSGVADSLSTAVFNMDLEEGKAFVESMEDVEALWVLPDESLEKSSGWQSKEE